MAVLCCSGGRTAWAAGHLLLFGAARNAARVHRPLRCHWLLLQFPGYATLHLHASLGRADAEARL